MKLEFIRCPVCENKIAGSTLCHSCTYNRKVISEMQTMLEPHSLNSFIQMLQKKKMEYLNNDMVDLRGCGTETIINEFQIWLMEQTAQYKKLKAERKELLSKADLKNDEMQNYLNGKWGNTDE